jgi:hypothetical protein
MTMSETNSANSTKRAVELSIAFAALALIAAGTRLGSAVAQQKERIPDFSLDGKSAWLMISDNLLPPESGPGPVTFDKRYPYVDNREARRTNSQPTYRVADLTNPILKPWVVEQLKKANDWVLAGKVSFRARERCYPSGVPSWVIYTLVQPIHIIQTPTHVTMIQRGRPRSATHLAQRATCGNPQADLVRRLAAAMYTIMRTAKLNEVKPEIYLRETLARIAEGRPISRI